MSAPVTIAEEPTLRAELMFRYLWWFSDSNGDRYSTMSSTVKAAARRAFIDKSLVRLRFTKNSDSERHQCYEVIFPMAGIRVKDRHV